MNINLHLPSVVAGTLIAAGLTLTMAQVAPRHLAGEPDWLMTSWAPHPRQYVQVAVGGAFVVPPGRLFVPTGLGVSSPTGGSSQATLRVDGVEIAKVGASIYQYNANASSIVTLPTGYAASSGAIVEVEGPSAVCWAYTIARE